MSHEITSKMTCTGSSRFKHSRVSIFSVKEDVKIINKMTFQLKIISYVMMSRKMITYKVSMLSKPAKAFADSLGPMGFSRTSLCSTYIRKRV